MPYVQGTAVRLSAVFTDPETHAAIDPPDVVLTVDPPTGTPFTRSYQAAEIQRERPGRYFYVLATDAEPGTWQYQFEAVGATVAVVERKAISVSRRLAASA